ncbi:MAG: hypothetical protein D6753_09390 [Planctomycetota bacterium]|nr:MAG: hypothetical protein D6753_09390 [Planctomycetota bacterium]
MERSPGVLGQLIRPGNRISVVVTELSPSEIRVHVDRQLFPRQQIAVYYCSRRILATVIGCRRIATNQFEVLSRIETVHVVND